MNHKKEYFTDEPLSSLNRNNMTGEVNNDLESISKQAIKHNKPRVIVIGGSLGGLCAAIALRSVDCDVEIFEKSHVEMKSRGAGIVIQMEVISFLKEHKIANMDAISVPAYKRQYLRKDGTTEWAEPALQLMTSWDMLYRHLRNAIPDELYHNNRKMTSFEQKDGHVVVHLGENRMEEKCDLLVGADGAGSTIRHQIFPKVLPSYAGYVAWRGLVNESEASSKLLAVFSNNFTFSIGPKTHILCYLIPGPNGEVSEGRRRLNWVWYVNAPKGDKFDEVLTDKEGILREFSVPYGMVSEDVMEKQKTVADDTLPDVFKQLVFATKDPFIQAIYDLSVPKMAFDRVCLIGDASFVVRPHTAASTSKASTNAVTLAKSIYQQRGDVIAALKKWEPSQLELGNSLKSLGIRLGNSS